MNRRNRKKILKQKNRKVTKVTKSKGHEKVRKMSKFQFVRDY